MAWPPTVIAGKAVGAAGTAGTLIGVPETVMAGPPGVRV
jgi:hypothetical protein